MFFIYRIPQRNSRLYPVHRSGGLELSLHRLFGQLMGSFRGTAMKLSVCLAMVAYITSNLAWAEACEVNTHAASPDIKVVDARTCYEYTGMPAGAINWSCSNESKDALA